jgi:hypothetical protein
MLAEANRRGKYPGSGLQSRIIHPGDAHDPMLGARSPELAED